jgi:hypothetical protein
VERIVADSQEQPKTSVPPVTAIAAAAQQLHGRRRCHLESLETPLQADWTPRVAHGIPLDHEGQTIGSMVSDMEKRQVVAFAASRLGQKYDMRHVFDLARYLFPPRPCRSDGGGA